MGESSDTGQAWSNVLDGSLNNNFIVGKWVRLET